MTVNGRKQVKVKMEPKEDDDIEVMEEEVAIKEEDVDMQG